MDNLSAVAVAVETFEQGIEEGKTTPLKKNIETKSIHDFIKSWKSDFTDRIKELTKSKKRDWRYYDAVKSSSFITDPLDIVMIEYLRFINTDPLKTNDYYKYVVSYQEGRELDIKFFKHNKEKLKAYYERIDEGQKIDFRKSSFEAYVLFMMLKLNGVYADYYNEMFNVKAKESREYNPLTNLPSVLRGVLPFKVEEYDIAQAFPSFIFKELNMEPFDVYERMGGDRKKAKKLFNTLINSHNESDCTIESVRKQLAPIYGGCVNDVITEDRFFNKGRTFEDFTKHEKEYIQKFVDANNLVDYVRLHDGVVLKENTDIKVTEFDYVKFIKGVFSPPVTENNIRPFHNDFNLTEASRYAEFFKQEGFIRLMIQGKDEISVIKNENKVVKHFNWKTETMSFLKANICSIDVETMQNTIASDEKKIKNGFLLMDSEPLKLHKDEKETVYISFKNGVAKISLDSIHMLPYDSDQVKFFAENESQKHVFNYDQIEGSRSDFFKFLTFAVIGRDDVSGNTLTDIEREEVTAFLSMIGYLVSNYKDPSKAFAVVLSDEGANNNDRKGRRGKSLILEALKKVRPVKWAQGDSFKTDYVHKFANLDATDDVFVVDDAPAKFNYNSFYGEITGDVKVERKGSAGEVIPFEYAPKFVFTTNYNFRYNEEDASTIGRFFEYKLKPFFSIERPVADYFKKTFFNDWDSDEWNAFYCFIADCVQTYLMFGIMPIRYDKSEDNYNAYFNNDVKEQEFERVLEELRPLEEFTTSKFLEVYKTGVLYSERLFNDKNVKKHLEVFTKHRSEYNIQRKSQTSRVWIFVD